jgi:hypothetical protein
MKQKNTTAQPHSRAAAPAVAVAVVEDYLKGARTLAGVVRFEDDAPIANVTVEVTTRHAGDLIPLAKAQTDREGRFSARLPADWKGEEPVIVVKDGAERVLHTSGPMQLHSGADWHVGLSVPSHARILLDRPEAILRPLTPVGPIAMAVDAVDGATAEDVVSIARVLVDPKADPKLIARVTRLSPELLPGGLPARTLCGTSVLEAIEALIRIRRLGRDVRLEVDRILRLRDLGFAEATHECPNFTVTYQTSGPAAVDPDTSAQDVYDPGTTDLIGSLPAGGAPTYIKRVCFWLERALAAYVSPPFSMLNPAAGGKIPVVINSSPYGSASPSGTFYLNNALNADLMCAVAVHELFHMVQYEYGGSGTWRQSVFEGGAVFAEDTAADRMNRYLDEAGLNFNGAGVLHTPNKSLSTASYKCSLFWRYLSEQQSWDIFEPFVGVETYRKVIEKCSAGSYSTADVKDAIRELPFYQDFYEFHYLDPAKLDRTSSETVFGNYAMACYLKDLGTNVPDRRFEFLEDEEDIYIDSVIPGAPPSSTLVAPTLSGTGTLAAAGSLAFSGSVLPFAHRFYEVNVDAAVTNIAVAFTAGVGLTSSVFQIVLIDEDGNVRDIHRTDYSTYAKRITSERDGKHLSKIGLVVSGADSGGSFDLSVQAAAPAPDVMVTRWHSKMMREYEIDSRAWAWTWISPDIWVDNDNDGNADGTVFFNFNNKLHIRLHNKGNQNAHGIQVQFYYQSAATGLSDAAWLPVQNKNGVIQTLTGLNLNKGKSKDWSVDWSPAPSGASTHFCIRAIVTVPGDPNTDNKRVLSNFGNVVVHPGMFVDIGLLRRNIELIPRDVSLRVIPRLTPELELSLRDVKEGLRLRLDPGESVLDSIRLTHRKLAAVREQQDDVVADVLHAAPKRQPTLPLAPDPAGYYPPDPDTLPPGVEGMPLVTVVHMVDGLPVGGATFMVTVEKAKGATAAARAGTARKKAGASAGKARPPRRQG